MQTGQEGLRLIKNYEGLRLEGYKCPAGILTIGYGHTGKVDGKAITLGMKISKEKAEDLLKSDLKRYENYVTATKLKLNQNQFDALVSFTYNCGSGCLQTLVKNRTLPQIAEALLKYNKGGGKVLAGLTKRRKAEKVLFLKAVGKTETKIEEKSKEVKVQAKTTEKKLPYAVKTICELNIRTAAGTNYPIIRKAKKGEILKVWAVCTSGGLQWGKNGKEFFALKYCEVI